MRFNKSITGKLLLSILIPIILMFALLLYLILSNVKNNTSKQTEEIIKRSSISASWEINQFFTKYFNIVDTASVNSNFIEYLKELTPGTKMNQAAQYSSINMQLQNFLNLDTENLLATWIADTDSSQIMLSDGFVSGEDFIVVDRPWYAPSIANGKATLTEPYVDAFTKEVVVSIVAPIYDGDSVLGVFGIDLKLNHLNTIMASFKLGNTGYYTFVTKDNTIIYHNNSDYILKNIEDLPVDQSVKDVIGNKEEGTIEYKIDGQLIHGYNAKIGDTAWRALSTMSDDEYNQDYVKLRNLLIIIILIIMLLVCVTVYLTSRNIVKPLKQLSVAADKIADGNLDVNLDIKTRDEIYLVADSFSRTVIRLKTYILYIKEISKLLNSIGEGNLNLVFEQNYDGDFKAIKDALVSTSNMLNYTISEFNAAAEQVANGSDQVSAGAQTLSQGTTEQASAIQELSATINEISEQIKQTADHADTAKQISLSANVAVMKGQQQMTDMIDAMNAINKTSNEISKIIKNIDDIAFQTNILALNAAVEAARAGSAGKGFAVVADEVRNLASKSAESAKNTAVLIESALEAIESGTKIVSETAISLNEVVEGSENSTKIIQKIADASAGQARSIVDINLGFEQISSVVQTNSATAEESAAASEELSAQAQMLKQLIGRFKLKEKQCPDGIS